MPKVSIIIPFYNCPYVSEAIASALNQTYQEREIIVVNDGSTRFTEKIQPYLEQIRYIEKSNGGTASALNAGIRLSEGEYIAWLSSDDYFLPDKLEKQLEWMIKNELKICFSSFYQMNEKSEIIGEPVTLYFQNNEQMERTLKRRNIFNGSTAIIHKKIFQEIGYFDESLLYTHDYDFWLRVAQITSIGYLDVPTVLYRIHEGMGSKKYKPDIRKELQYIRNNSG